MSDAAGAPLRYTCPRCGAHVSAKAEHAGTRRQCPSCGQMIKVPGTPPRAPRSTSRGDSPSRPAAVASAPSASGEVQQSPEPPAVATGRPPFSKRARIVVSCGHCGKMIHAAADRLGQTVDCPDCLEPVRIVQGRETSIVSGPPATQPQPHDTTDNDDELKLADPVERTAFAATVHPDLAPEATRAVPPAAQPPARPLVPAEDEQFTVACPVCGTRIDTDTDQVGKQAKCPDCFTQFEVRQPPVKPRPRSIWTGGGAEDFALADPVERPKAMLPGEQRPRTDADDALERARQRRREEDEQDRLPEPEARHIIYIVSFLKYPGGIARLVGLSLLAAMEMGLVFTAISMSTSKGIGQFISVLSCIGAAILGLFFAITVSVNLLAILQDTANGHDEVQDWPDMAFLDWMTDSFFVVNAFIFSALPGVGAYLLLDVIGVSPGVRVLLLPLSVALLFPVVLLSMLESGSMFVPISRPVAESILESGRYWGLFYVGTVAVAFAGWVGLSVLSWHWAIMALPVALIFVALLMIYFRMLGFLAHACIQALAEEEPRERQRGEKPASESSTASVGEKS